MSKWLKQRRFACLLAAGLVAFEASIFFCISFSAPAGTRWLGDTMYFPGDTAVYLSYIHQIADGSSLQNNLYETEHHLLRFNPFWTALGLLSRLHISPLNIYIATSLALTFCLVMILYEIARRTTGSVANAKLATTIAVLGGTSGWMYTIYITLFSHWGWKTVASPDLGSEFSIFPVLFGGPHNILSTGLILLGMYLTWKGIIEGTSIKRLLLYSLPAAVLFSYHPYFVPLFIIFTSLAILMDLSAWKERCIRAIALLALPGLVTLAIYIPEAWDRTLVQQHLVTNQQPLAPLLAWVATLAIPASALIWRWKKHLTLKPEEHWVVAWLLSVIVFILLPLPWKRKATQGTAVALVLLGLPLWSYMTEKIRNISFKPMRHLISLVFWIFVALTPLQLVVSQLSWIAQQDRLIWFYRPENVFAAWNFLHDKTDSTSTIMMTDDAWLNLWSPAYAVRTVFVGHDHESPDYEIKMEEWKNALADDNSINEKHFLEKNHISDIMLTQASSDKLEAILLDLNWRKVFVQDGVRILERP